MFTPLNLKQLNKNLELGHWPVFSDVSTTQNSCTLTLIVPRELSYFAGHFPDRPVLPGIVQVHWAIQLTKIFFTLNQFRNLRRLKFHNMLRPNTTLKLYLEYQTDTESVKFRYFSDELIYSSGTLQFRSTGADKQS
jgi:3-hydroxymyristoyl/3-hydroxydecanoyl-(acyl carrier protein) dehydratase